MIRRQGRSNTGNKRRLTFGLDLPFPATQATSTTRYHHSRHSPAPFLRIFQVPPDSDQFVLAFLAPQTLLTRVCAPKETPPIRLGQFTMSSEGFERERYWITTISSVEQGWHLLSRQNNARLDELAGKVTALRSVTIDIDHQARNHDLIDSNVRDTSCPRLPKLY